jgi:hypothetical protein
VAVHEGSFWLEIAKVLGTGVVAAALTHGVSWWRDSRKEKASNLRDARYLALRLAVILERFAIDCSEVVGLVDTYAASKGSAGSQTTKLPEIGEFPSDSDWKTIDPKLAARALEFVNELLMAQQKLNFSWHVSDEDQITEECADDAALLGLRAWDLAHQLRQRHDLPRFTPAETSHDVEASLKARCDAARGRAEHQAADVDL